MRLCWWIGVLAVLVDSMGVQVGVLLGKGGWGGRAGLRVGMLGMRGGRAGRRGGTERVAGGRAAMRGGGVLVVDDHRQLVGE